MSKKKKYDYEANNGNTPHLLENIIFIVMEYEFSGVNSIIAGIYAFEKKEVNSLLGGIWETLIIIGIVLLCRGYNAIGDRRKDMCDSSYAFSCIIIHLAISIFVSYTISQWWIMILFVIEEVIAVCIVWIHYRKHWGKKKRKRK